MCQLSNIGTRHLRPFISWFVRSTTSEIVAERNVEATVLMPESTSRETLRLDGPLAPGTYELEAQVDFQDGRAVQAVRRTLEVAGSSASR